jgi:exodeoxyribonuclease VIII
MKTDLQDGIYLDMPFDQYLALPRISDGGLTRLMEGPASFWAGSWMNPDRKADEDTKAMPHGRAYHCARLEPDQFAARYVRQISPEDYGDRPVLKNGTQIGEALADMGQTKKRAGESVLDQAQRLVEVWTAEVDEPHDKRPVIWPLEEHRFAQEREKDGREAIDPKTWGEILRDAERVRMNPEIEALLTGGLAEVTILFTDPDTGVACKIRPDYLGASWVAHLKTWDAKAMGKPGNRAIVDAFRFNGY